MMHHEKSLSIFSKNTRQKYYLLWWENELKRLYKIIAFFKYELTADTKGDIRMTSAPRDWTVSFVIYTH